MIHWAGLLGVACCSICLARTAAEPSFRIGLNFTSTTQGESHTKATAPDANGAAGPGHVVELINGDFKVYDKRSGALLIAQSSEAFWEKALGAAAFAANPHHADPRVVFDVYAGRWYASAQRPRPPVDGEMSVMVARSETSDPTAGWKGVSILVDPDRAPKTGADFDRLGYNRDGLYLSINQFDMRPDGRLAPNGVALFSIKKSDFNLATPVLTLDRRDHVTDISDATPVIDLDGTSRTGTFWGVVQGRAARLAPTDLFARTDLRSDVTAWTLDRATTVIGDRAPHLLLKTTVPMEISQPDADHRMLSFAKRPATTVQLVNGEFWLVHAASHPDDSTRSAIRWWRIRASDNAVLGEGVLADPTLSLFIPSIAVDRQGRVVIGCAGTSATQFLSAYAIAGRVSGEKVVFDSAVTLLKAGTSAFTSSVRWGDYTTTVVDPSSPGTFWTFLVSAQQNGEWATQITQLIVTPAAKPTGTKQRDTPGRPGKVDGRR
ncbi:MAG: hypothetical protein IMZ67_03515 [Acidobacteria bacterium]|nr:hypothetical protein [Acidobacteriota bacterium]